MVLRDASTSKNCKRIAKNTEIKDVTGIVFYIEKE